MFIYIYVKIYTDTDIDLDTDIDIDTDIYIYISKSHLHPFSVFAVVVQYLTSVQRPENTRRTGELEIGFVRG